ncbi:MAG TPA: Pycsar system effector family protein [Candidatus Lumbricidophila sp.]|nr:Pycsar system effector family protein [Candidatus Lumbricidophila sp.]
MGKSERMAAEQMLAEAREDVKHADQKASVLLAALGIGFGAVVGGQLQAGWSASSLSGGSQTMFWIGVALAVASVGACALAVWPRYDLNERPDYGVTYWGHIAAFKRLADLEDALDAQSDPSERRVRHQLWKVSQLVLTKYRCVRWALVLGASAGALLYLATVVIR